VSRIIPLVLFMAVVGSIIAAPPAEEKELAAASRQNAGELAAAAAELVSAVGEHCPELLARFDQERQCELLQKLASGFPGVEYLSASAAAAELVQPPSPVRGGPYPGIIVAANQVLYLRLDSFSEPAVEKACADIAGAVRLLRAPVGVVFDLRNAGGEDYAGAVRLLRLFRANAPRLGSEPEGDQPEQVQLPAIVMVGHETTGAAEVFAALLERGGNALTMGQPTAGRPFPKRKLRLRRGDLLLVPDVPPPLRSVRSEPVQPAVVAKSGPQADYELLAGKVDGDESDLCLQRAVDLLLSLHALHLRSAPSRKE